MEAKKSKSANLERHRWARFLFAFLGATLLLVLALEVKLPRWQSSDLPELSEEIFQDLEMKKEIDREEWVAVAPKRENPPPAANVRAVDLSMLPPEAPTSGMPQLVAQSDADVQAAEDLDAALVDNEAKDTPLSFRVVEELPEFPGGMTAFMQWLTENLKYPNYAQRQKIEGKVVVSFIVNTDGGVEDLKVVRGAHRLLDQEALRVLGKMPQWTPGTHRGSLCRTMIAIPVVFKL